MNKTENEFLINIAHLMTKCPDASPNPSDLTGWIHSSRDFSNINRLVSSILQNYTVFETYKTKMGTDEVDGEWVMECRDEYLKCYQELQDFVNKRSEEGWS